MPDQETTQNTPTPDSSPTAPSATPETGLEPQNAPTDGFTPVPVESPNEPVNTTESNPENASFPAGGAPAEPVSEPVQASEPSTAQTPVNEPLTQNKQSLAQQLLITARNAIQFRKRKKLDRIMSLFLQHSKITNDEVEKFLHVSDATATRYLSTLEKEGKIKQNGKTGHMVSYSRI
jgi:hypothetical protein